MSIRRAAPFAVVALLMTSAVPLLAQRRSADLESARPRIQASLRAFYFNLARRDWVALTADILPAKVVAHRPVPESLVTVHPSRGSADGVRHAADTAACPSEGTALVEQATIRLDGDWAEVSVPRCSASAAGADEFRLIHFERRWRLVYFDLLEEPLKVWAGR
jgi:hypothetical protein